MVTKEVLKQPVKCVGRVSDAGGFIAFKFERYVIAVCKAQADASRR